jgi:hypothetical protein
VLLNYLCEFDFAYCVIVFAKRSGHGEAFPSSAEFSEDRAKPMAVRIVADAEIRNRLIPEATNAEVAHALRETYRHAIRESLPYGGRW